MSKRFVYVLKNGDRYYTGLTSDVARRLAEHNAGTRTHTAKYRPWSIDVVIEFSDERRAGAFERYLKVRVRCRIRQSASAVATLMRFFTKAWIDGEMPDAEAEKVPAAYLAHLAALGPTLPDVARRLANEVSLHDGLLRGVELTNERLELLFRAGDQQISYFDAWLKYDGVGIAEADAQFLISADGCPEIELLYDEFDRHQRNWVHHLLFWLPGRQYHEVSVRFGVIELQVFPATARFDGGAA